MSSVSDASLTWLERSH